MPAEFKAFVSSTFLDLKAHRRHVIDALRHAGFFVDPMEDWTADSDEPRRFSTDRIDGCDLCVLLVAFRRGFVPPGERLSITQLEYERAVTRGLDVLVFLLDENAPWPRAFDELDDVLTGWRKALTDRHGVSVFGLDPRSIEIAPALTRWVAGRQRKAIELGADWTNLVTNLLGLPKNEPETRAVAARLLPVALAAVVREYYGTATTGAPAVLTRAPAAPEPPAGTSPASSLVDAAVERMRLVSDLQSRACYVLTPFGRKLAADGRIVDFDAIFHHLFVPAIQRVAAPGGGVLQPVRADVDLLSGGASRELQDYLEFSRLVLADLTVPNANVFYELGLRHRGRAAGTVLVAQDEASVPFDLARMRVTRYRLDSPAAVDESIESLGRALEAALRAAGDGA
ncbi:MAG: DUF4062 domain-containing protein [Vicinamibacterales bacterium]